MSSLSPDFVQKALQLPVISGFTSNRPFTAVHSDSRKVGPGSLFVALKGELQDGHDFIEKALSQGATGLVCQKNFLPKIPKTPSLNSVSIFAVEDTLLAYRQLAGAWRRNFSIPVIAVAGSAGKTTTKELLAAILLGKWSNVLKTQGSQNGFVGIPMTLLELRPEHQAAVIEIGIDETGAMQQHVSLVAPTAAVLTAIGPEHLEKLQDLPTVAREEGIALTFVSQSGGTTIINLDDPLISAPKEGTKILFKLDSHPDHTPKQVIDHTIVGKLNEDESVLEFMGAGFERTAVTPPLPGKHNASNLLAAIASAAAVGLTAKEIVRGLSSFKGATGRSELRTLGSSIQVICDYYNAQPASVTAGLNMLDGLFKKSESAGRTFACLGDMLEMGTLEEQLHRALAPQLIQLGIQNVLLFGPRMAALEHELKKQHYAGFCQHFSKQADLSSALTARVQPR